MLSNYFTITSLATHPKKHVSRPLINAFPCGVRHASPAPPPNKRPLGQCFDRSYITHPVSSRVKAKHFFAFVFGAGGMESKCLRLCKCTCYWCGYRMEKIINFCSFPVFISNEIFKCFLSPDIPLIKARIRYA